MTSKRTIALMAILLALLAGYLTLPKLMLYLEPPAAVSQVLPGQNSVSNVRLVQEADTRWYLSFDYYYTGEPRALKVGFTQWVGTSTPNAGFSGSTSYPVVAQRGKHSVKLPVPRPSLETINVTREVVVEMVRNAQAIAQTVVAQKLVQRIEWPTPAQEEVDYLLATGKPQAAIDVAVKLIDMEDRRSLESAKARLERVIEKNPRIDAAYVELARVAMKTNWGPEGLRQAETLLGMALKIDPASVNAKILLAYVYGYQKRYKESEALLVDASKVETPNLWLWANWGEMLEMQGKGDAAIAKYREAVARPVSDTSYDRARRHALYKLVALLEERNDFDGAEAMHKQQAQDYGYGPCTGAAYAMFMLRRRADGAAAIDIARKAGKDGCAANDVREILGAANYLLWSTSAEAQRAEALNRARVYMPAGPRLFYGLAASDRLAEVARQLIATGDRVDQQDNFKFTALAYALRDKDLAAARRLLRLGAKPGAPIGEEELPAALIPVMVRDVEGIRMLQRAGVDFSKIRYRGTTALDHARSTGDKQMLQVLQPKVGEAV